MTFQVPVISTATSNLQQHTVLTSPALTVWCRARVAQRTPRDDSTWQLLDNSCCCCCCCPAAQVFASLYTLSRNRKTTDWRWTAARVVLEFLQVCVAIGTSPSWVCLHC